MNNQIQELLEKVGGYGTQSLTDSEDIKKFALLVMRECASACNSFDCGRTMSSQELIESHFGVSLEN